MTKSPRLSLRFSFGRVKGHTWNYCAERGRAWERGYPISPSGAVTFVSSLYPGFISDKELTHRSGLLDLLEVGDSVMADRGFDIQEELALLLNIPLFLRGKKQLSSNELVEIRRISALRIHVEKAMEQTKNFHNLTDPFHHHLETQPLKCFMFVLYILTNFNPPLCT